MSLYQGGDSLLGSCGNIFARQTYQLIGGSADQPNLEERPRLLNNKLDEGEFKGEKVRSACKSCEKLCLLSSWFSSTQSECACSGQHKSEDIKTSKYWKFDTSSRGKLLRKRGGGRKDKEIF